jgi:molybdopterin-guanine dinucleotide biosynthesis protein
MATDYKIRALSYRCHEYRCEVVNADGKTVTIDLAGQDQHKLERAG